MREKKKGKRKEKNSTRDRKRKQLGEKNTRGRWKRRGRGERTQKGGTEKKERKKGKIIKGPDDDITCVEEDVTYVGASQARGGSTVFSIA